MEIRDRFIIGIFNYCDRWCERCELTSRCRLFANVAGHEAGRGTALSDTPLLQDPTLAPPRWFEDILEDMTSLAGGSVTEHDLAACEPKMSSTHEEIYERAKAYCIWAYDCVRVCAQKSPLAIGSDPLAVIYWFSSLNAAQIRRALVGLAEFDGYREIPPDHEGAAKVALIGIDRSYDAWQQLVADYGISAAQARPCLEELSWIRLHLEEAIPRARSFVRPGFDEPDALGGMVAAGRAWNTAGTWRYKEKARRFE